MADPAGFEDLFVTQHERLVRSLEQRRPGRGEDLASRTFEKALRSYPTRSFESREQEIAWLWRIAANLVIDDWRVDHQPLSLDKLQPWSQWPALAVDDPAAQHVERAELQAAVRVALVRNCTRRQLKAAYRQYILGEHLASADRALIHRLYAALRADRELRRQVLVDG